MCIPNGKRRPMFRLSQETIAIVTVGLALAGLVVTDNNGIREEIQSVRAEGRADHQALRDEARADREAWQAEAQSLRDEARADREAFEKHITRLIQSLPPA